jgi:signal transduction histidine kinase
VKNFKKSPVIFVFPHEKMEIYAAPLLENVFYILVDNAVQHGGKISLIRFSVEYGESEAVILCEDDGAGIPAGDKERIFKRGTRKKTDINLFLAREILAHTGISIRETGEPGKGARFEMRVPKGMWRIAGDIK